VSQPDFRPLLFFELQGQITAVIVAQGESDKTLAYREVSSGLAKCLETIDEVYAHFRQHGVSSSLVYQIECLRTQIRRCHTLAKLLMGHEQGKHFVQEFFGLLVIENIHARKLGKLLKDNLVLVRQKIVETNLEAGDHYITRDRGE